MKVVIPRKTTSDRHLQTPNDDLTRDFVYTHQEYSKVAKLVQNRHNVENSKIAINQDKFTFYRICFDFTMLKIVNEVDETADLSATELNYRCK